MSTGAIVSLEFRDEVGSSHMHLPYQFQRSTQTLRTLQWWGVGADALGPALPHSDPCSNFLPGGCGALLCPSSSAFSSVPVPTQMWDKAFLSWSWPHAPLFMSPPTLVAEHWLWSPGHWAHCTANSCLSQRGGQLPVTRRMPAAPRPPTIQVSPSCSTELSDKIHHAQFSLNFTWITNNLQWKYIPSTAWDIAKITCCSCEVQILLDILYFYLWNLDSSPFPRLLFTPLSKITPDTPDSIHYVTQGNFGIPILRLSPGPYLCF